MSSELLYSSKARVASRQMRRVREALRMLPTEFSVLLGLGIENLRSREACRNRWPGNPLRDHRRKIEAELARMERDIAAVRVLLSEAATPVEAVASAPTPAPVSATAHPMEAATA